MFPSIPSRTPDLTSDQPPAPDPAAVDPNQQAPAPTDQVAPETAPAAEPVVEPAAEPVEAAPAIKAGQLVSHTSFDPYIGAGGEEVTQVALVLAVEEGLALVAFLPVSGPVPLDELEPGPELA